MYFDTVERIVAFEPALLAQAEQLTLDYGADCQGVRTLAVWDDGKSGKLRPARKGKNFAPMPLTDGRFAGIGRWSLTALQALEGIEGADEITREQLENLRIKQTEE